MPNSLVEILQWANLLIFPALFYIIKLERRLLSLELRLEMAVNSLVACRRVTDHENGALKGMAVAAKQMKN